MLIVVRSRLNGLPLCRSDAPVAKSLADQRNWGQIPIEIGVRSQLILAGLATLDFAVVLGVPTLTEANIANTCAAIEKFMAWAGGGVEQLSVTQN